MAKKIILSLVAVVLLAGIGFGVFWYLQPEKAQALVDKAAAEVAAPEVELGKAEDFTLLDHTGKSWSLSRSKAHKVIVLIAATTGDETVAKVVGRVKGLQQQFGSQGVQFALLNVNPADTREQLIEEAAALGSTFPILKDSTQLVGFGLKLKTSGEAVAISTADQSIIYRGAVDSGFASEKVKGNPNYLETAIQSFLRGEKVAVRQVAAEGAELPLAAADPTPVSYAHQVVPILKQYCVECHSKGNIGPFAMSSYQKVNGMSAMIKEVVIAQRMPPWHADPHVGKFSNAKQIKPEEALTLVRWIDQGSPKGDGEDPLADAALADNDGWPLGKPDYIVKFSKVENIPATGTLDYRYVIVPSPIRTNAWLRAAVVKPGNRKVVHHALILSGTAAEMQGSMGGRGQRRPGNNFVDGYFSAYVPGYLSTEYPEGTGKLLKAGSLFLFQMHYTTTGKEETDSTEMGLYLSKEKPVSELLTRSAFDVRFRIPAQAAAHETFAEYEFKKESVLYELSPHMHLRGKSFQYELVFPDATREVILSVPHYDFKWQHLYRLADARKVPAKTKLICRGTHDNSPFNPDNPDPTQEVRFGDQTDDEMFIGYFNYAEMKPGLVAGSSPSAPSVATLPKK